MKKWGVVVTIFYVLAVVCLVAPAIFLSVGEFFTTSAGDYFRFVVELYRQWIFWVWAGILIGGEALLFIVSVDRSRRLPPMQHVAVSILTTTTFIAILTQAVMYSLVVTIIGKASYEWPLLSTWAWLIVLFLLAWAFWGLVFFVYMLGTSRAISRVVGWLIAGSVLELLIVVPCHLVVRRRNDCSAPPFTSYGIATGIAVMLLAFGPSVLFLYKKQLQRYKRPKERMTITS